ncbi:MAG: hypothetical protein K0U98_20605 [Deltaproteobacteria bacterium]|nr:hypothetical protein [Deltaproteobacteria bacterium]
MSYPYDPQTRAYVARLLYQHLPALYRVEDQPPKGRAELERFLQVLAAPLATLRQNIEELHADLFIDSAADEVLPLLAEMVGTTLLFPEPDANRRDIRGTVGWRRRKGTVATLEELAANLVEQLAASHEGWKVVQMTQDLDLLRPDRVVPDLRDRVLAEKVSGPLVATHHSVDLRRIGRHTGKYHPRHVFHYVHPTRLFDLQEGSPRDLTAAPDPDLRFSFHPLAADLPLRLRRTADLPDPATDRALPEHFAADPGRWFGRAGGFRVEIAGLPAAVARDHQVSRRADRSPASQALLEGAVTIELLEHDPRRFPGPVRLEVVAAPFAGAPGIPDTNPAGFEVRSELVLDAVPPGPSAVINAGAVDATAVPMLRLVPVGVGARFFPGAVVEIAGGEPVASRSSERPQLAREGFLRGSLFVDIPATRVDGERWFYLAADGSVHDAQLTGTGVADVVIDDFAGEARFDRDHLISTGSGPGWPALPASSDPTPWIHLPGAPDRGPIPLHGGRALRDNGGSVEEVPPATECALVFAFSAVALGVRTLRPFARLHWQGPGSATAIWEALDDDGTSLAPAAVGNRFAELADFRETGPAELRLAIRFECSDADALLAPSEVGITSDDGRDLLVHLPEMVAAVGSPVAEWPLDGGFFTAASEAVTAGVDGSTWVDASTANARRSLGQVAPLSQYSGLRRRRVYGRSLCQWRNEILPAQVHAATPRGHLDIDVLHGLFSLALEEPPQSYPLGPLGAPGPPALTVTYQQGYSAHTGALPAPREGALDRRLATPTRLVSRSGHLHRNAPAPFHDLPRHRTLGEALNAASASGEADEVIQVEDSLTYPGESLEWPAGVERLTVQAAEGRRPVFEVSAWGVEAGALLERWSLLGLTFGGAGLGALVVPPCGRFEMEYCTVTEAENTLDFPALGEGTDALIRRSLTAGFEFAGGGVVEIVDSVVDTGLGAAMPAVVAPDARLAIDRTTLFGTVACQILDASRSISKAW